ncbi:FtsX-like permease family protein [Lentimicrobium sp. L6]|uniref:ABC transporter permease n=1 Tax=Lentimicrobium sp. L6 TaxID=2735916 RepID=UPI00155551A7|nr:ABC transporter permease [Lentimicrobium sp. L6]NPD85914.1 FtsX-like permease family protein [Lentimicrobium sp. L6]
MIKFLLKGILGDKNRSLLPIIIISIGVMLTIFLSGYMRGAMGDMIEQNARFQTGHVKVMSRAYAENESQMPNDLALLGVSEIQSQLEKDFPDVEWVDRIRFGGLLDVPDANGETKGQGPSAGMALELFSKNTGEVQRLNMEQSIVRGEIPSKKGEALIGEDFATKLDISIGDRITFMGTTMNGSMTFADFIVSGTIRFGSAALDRGILIIDISDARYMLDMEDAAGEIIGFLGEGLYVDEKATEIAQEFNEKYAGINDEFAPLMLRLRDQNNLDSYLEYVDGFASMFVTIFVLVMSIVLWNTGLLGGLRRYQEFGIRLALGEEKGHIYRSLIYEAILIGIIGSIVGTTLGLLGTWYMQVVGIDITGMMQNSTMLMPNVLRSKFTPELLYIGFIPGLVAMVLGNMLSGIGIYKRETATLFKELEV